MKQRLASGLVAVLWLACAHGQDRIDSEVPSGTPLAVVVQDLGKDQRDLKRIQFLQQQPAEAARLLVQELHPVTAVRILGNEHELLKWRDAEHVVWCLRALRSLTGGLEFRATTAYRFRDSEIEENQEWFTGGEQFKRDRKVKFFGVWMSRDSLYIAPRDAQEQIIRKWKHWYEAEGISFAYPPFKDDPDIWYF